MVPLCLCVRDRYLTLMSAYGPENSAVHLIFCSLVWVLDRALTGTFIVLLGDFNAHVDNVRNGLPDLLHSTYTSMLITFCPYQTPWSITQVSNGALAITIPRVRGQ